MNAQRKFWNWFLQHEATLFDFDPEQEAEREKLFDELAGAMQEVHPNLTFEFSPKSTTRFCHQCRRYQGGLSLGCFLDGRSTLSSGMAIRTFFESQGLLIQEWDRVRTDWLKLKPVGGRRAAAATAERVIQ